MNAQTTLFVIALSYMIGSFPTAYIIGRLKGINIFDYGSGNMGATNTMRTLGFKWGFFVLGIDLAKGVLAVWLARQIAPAQPLSTQASASVIAAVAVVVGHNWSFFASIITGSIRGGKGVATAGGTWLILMPTLAIALPIAILVLIVVTTRYMSLAVMTAAVVGAVIVAVLVSLGTLQPVFLLYTMVTGMIILRHKDNIKRLLAGNERRLGERVQIN